MRRLALVLLPLGAPLACHSDGASDAAEPAASAVARETPPATDAARPRDSTDSRDRIDSPRGPALTPAMRELLRDRMVQHGRDMARLQRVTLDLEYDLIEQSSAWLAEEPAVARPAMSDRALLRAGLPPRFFQLEAELRGKAIILRGAALVRDDEAIAVAYGRVAETCIRCHALYRGEGGEGR
jgi:hypothetical protein